MIYCEAEECRTWVSMLFSCGTCHLMVCEKCWKASHRAHNQREVS